VKDQFNDNADFFNPDARVVNIPAHTVIELDSFSIREDAARLKGWTSEQVYAEYGIKHDIPAQAFAFTSWDKVPWDMRSETKELLKKALEDDDVRTPDALKGRIVLSPRLRFKAR
jgi:hypothetical protein